ncbi:MULTISPECIES: hypothetical protein [unclassified Vibrio]|uniref:Nitrate/nitrite sensing protein domain-containing protein n=1 Tax=Vibrio sp. HB236076 TaxID=3232307 RepID=A0AB39HDN8_9VIBR|nr:hypothetical protein [Vibrio sp. HB161653]MDP5253712.1 hypothetical protein [Vibrio sp. HB161653]
MFIMISISLSLLFLVGLYLLSQQRDALYSRHYELLMGLRELISHCREHRQLTHYALQFDDYRPEDLALVAQQMDVTCEHLVDTAPVETRAMFRILQIKIHDITRDWSRFSLAKNQMRHGEAIRQCLFLLDDMLVTWLRKMDRDDLTYDYHRHWHVIVDSLDALTQMRIAIEDNQPQRLRERGEVLIRRLHQLSLISKVSSRSPSSGQVIKQLEELCESTQHLLDADARALYQLTTALSLTIFTTYDNLVADVISQFDSPLPTLTMI